MWKCLNRIYKNKKIEGYDIALYNPISHTIKESSRHIATPEWVREALRKGTKGVFYNLDLTKDGKIRLNTDGKVSEYDARAFSGVFRLRYEDISWARSHSQNGSPIGITYILLANGHSLIVRISRCSIEKEQELNKARGTTDEEAYETEVLIDEKPQKKYYSATLHFRFNVDKFTEAITDFAKAYIPDYKITDLRVMHFSGHRLVTSTANYQEFIEATMKHLA